MDDHIKGSIKAYEEAKIEEREVKARIEELKEVIAPYIIENHAKDELQLSEGKIVVKHRAAWKFSEGTNSLAVNLKEVQKEEIAKGIATDTGVDYIEYRADRIS